MEGKDNIIAFEEGAELRNDITSGILLGGEQQLCLTVEDPGDQTAIAQFWGYQDSSLLIPFGIEGNQPIVEFEYDELDRQYISLNAPLLRFFKYCSVSVYLQMEHHQGTEESVFDSFLLSQLGKEVKVEMLYNLLFEIWCVRALTICCYMLQVYILLFFFS